jgi:secreted trypsin-like serine protease
MTVGDGADKKLIGIVSFGPKNLCGTGLPTAFTRVPFYRDWIRQKTGI